MNAFLVCTTLRKKKKKKNRDRTNIYNTKVKFCGEYVGEYSSDFQNWRIWNTVRLIELHVPRYEKKIIKWERDRDR